jgi:thioredoxin-related protein
MFLKYSASLFLFFLIITSCRNGEKRLVPVPPILQIEHGGTLHELLVRAKSQHKKLFIVFSFEKCGLCRIFAKYHNDPQVAEILSKYFIISKIDYYKTPDGKELYKKYGLPGFPSWVIMDETGKLLINSEAPVPGIKDMKCNIGYPSGQYELDYYILAVKRTAPSITEAECAVLRQKLREAKTS